MILGYEEHFVNGLLVKRCGNSDNECYLGQDPLLTPGLLGSSSIGKSLKKNMAKGAQALTALTSSFGLVW